MLFYRWETDEGRRKKYAYGLYVQGEVVKTVKCEVCGREWRKTEREPNFCVIMTNNNFPDFSYFIGCRLISQRALDILYKENVKDFYVEPFPVISADELSEESKREFRRDRDNVNKFGVDPPKYYWIRAQRRAKLHGKSNILYEECSACGFSMVHSPGKTFVMPGQPRIIDLSTWDGNDLFTVTEIPAAIFSTERFRDLYREYKMTGLDFKETEGI